MSKSVLCLDYAVSIPIVKSIKWSVQINVICYNLTSILNLGNGQCLGLNLSAGITRLGSHGVTTYELTVSLQNQKINFFVKFFYSIQIVDWGT